MQRTVSILASSLAALLLPAGSAAAYPASAEAPSHTAALLPPDAGYLSVSTLSRAGFPDACAILPASGGNEHCGAAPQRPEKVTECYEDYGRETFVSGASDDKDALIASLIAKAKTSRLSLRYSFKYSSEDGLPLRFSGTLLVQQDKYAASGNGLNVYCDGRTRWVVDYEAREVYVQPAEDVAQLLGYGDSLSELSVSDVKSQPLSDDLNPFTFDTGSLSDDWVVTDLR